MWDGPERIDDSCASEVLRGDANGGRLRRHPQCGEPGAHEWHRRAIAGTAGGQREGGGPLAGVAPPVVPPPAGPARGPHRGSPAESHPHPAGPHPYEKALLPQNNINQTNRHGNDTRGRNCPVFFLQNALWKKWVASQHW